jgi:hypothetical protein
VEIATVTASARWRGGITYQFGVAGHSVATNSNKYDSTKAARQPWMKKLRK